MTDVGHEMAALYREIQQTRAAKTKDGSRTSTAP